MGDASAQCALAKRLLSGKGRSSQAQRLMTDTEAHLERYFAEHQFDFIDADHAPDPNQEKKNITEKFNKEKEKFKKLKDSIEEKETVEAMELLNLAASQKNIDALLCLSDLYHTGKRVPQDLKRAAEFDLKAAELGSSRAMGNLGWDYGKGEGVTKDINEALKWLEKGYEKGNSFSCYWLALREC